MSGEREQIEAMLARYTSAILERQLQEMRDVIEGIVGLIGQNEDIKQSRRIHTIGQVIEQKVAPAAIPFFAAMVIEVLAEQRKAQRR